MSILLMGNSPVFEELLNDVMRNSDRGFLRLAFILLTVLILMIVSIATAVATGVFSLPYITTAIILIIAFLVELNGGFEQLRIDESPEAKVFMENLESSLHEKYEFDTLWGTNANNSIRWYQELLDNETMDNMVKLSLDDNSVYDFNVKVINDEAILFTSPATSNTEILSKITITE